jgi:hypothetical protein
MFSNIWKGKNGYNLPFGTYYWMAGATEGSNNGFYYYMNQTSVPGGPTFQFRSSHIGDPSRYAPVWDQDTRRNATVRTRDYTSHAFNPGRTFTFADGHAKFYPDSGSETRDCTLADTNYLRGAEHITPYYHSYCVMYAASKTACGATYNNAVPANPRPTALTRGILTIPSN